MPSKRATAETKALIYVNDRLTVEPLPAPESINEPHPMAEALADFMQKVDDIYFAVRIMVPATADIMSKKAKKLDKVLADAEEKIRTGSPAEAASAGAAIVDAGHEAERLYRSRLPAVVEQSFFVNIFSEYDYFFGALLRELYKRRPDLLSSISKQISFDQLIKFDSIESIRNLVLESEIDSIRRESYVEQFAILNKKFGIPLTKFPEWPEFVESTQRRNLLVHCGGHVSEQYLQVCDEAGYKFKNRPKVGDRLEIGLPYFERSAGLVARVGFMLTHTLWRKVLPRECERANAELNDQIYRLLCAKRWRTSAELGTFSLSEPMINGTTDIQKRVRLINTAIALKNQERLDEMLRLISSVDWTASVRDFRLAVSILKNETETAVSIMKQIGKRGELVDEIAYHQWPLFVSFRETPQFHTAYEEIFGYPFYLKAEKNAEEARSKLGKSTEAGEADPPTTRHREASTSDKPSIPSRRKRSKRSLPDQAGS